MRVPTNLRTIRAAADLSLTEVEEITGVSRGELSRIETGRALPRDEWVDQLELAYGAPDGWYDPKILLLIQADRDEDVAA